MKTFLFPGQGSQAKGMGRGLFEEYKDLTEKADKILGYSIEELCLDDPEGNLNQTEFTQTALYVVNALSYYKKIEETGEKPDYLAGHSLGEFNALLASECFSFEQGLKLVKKRGELMGKANGGGMAAILNATPEEIKSILEENGLINIDLANYNTISQIVISGLKDEIEKAQSLFQDGNILFISLKTSGAFHSRYMEPAKKEFKAYLKKFKFLDLKTPVISNVYAKPYENEQVMNNLSDQMTSPVRWSDSIRYLLGLEDMEFEEIGHGNVLKKLVAKIKEEATVPTDKKKETYNINEKENENIDKDNNIQGKLDDSKDETNNIERDVKTAEEKVSDWNRKYPIGTRVKSILVEDEYLETRTEAVVLFGHRAAVYMKDYNGYFDIDEITPL